MKTILLFLSAVITLPAISKENKALEITEIEQGVYLHTSFKDIKGYGIVDSNGLIVVDGQQAFIIDTPWSEDDTESLLTWITDKGYDVKASISTHSHEDRTAGIELLNSKSIDTHTSELTKNILKRQGKPTPTHFFKGDKFTLGNGLVELYYPGAGHTKDNIVAWLPKSKILFGGCIVRGHEWKSLGYVGEASIHDWADSIESITAKGYDIKIIVPGHGEIGGPSILQHTIKLANSASKKLNQSNVKK